LIRGDNDTEEGIAEGVLIEEEISIFGQSETAIHVSEQGLDIIQEWIAEGDFAGQVDITYQMALTDIIGQITGSGVGTMVMATETGEQASQVVPIMIDSNVYPFSIPSPKNRRLNGL
jgi:hypothetical protein